MFSLNKKSAPILGIDISATAIKLLELSRSGSKYRVESYAVEALPPNSVSDKTINDIEQVGEAVARAVKKAGTRTKSAAVCVAGSSVITKVISMPSGLNDDEMESQIQVEADQYIPFPLEEVSMDFEIIGESGEGADRVDVLLAASRSEVVDNVVASIELGGLSAKVVDIEAFAIENTIDLMSRGFPAGTSTDAIAVADVGSAITTFSVLENMKTLYSREETFGGSQLTEDIQRRYGLSYEEAGLAKRQGGLPDNYEPEVLEPFKDNMASQVGRALQFFYASSQISEIDVLVLAGGCSSIPGIAELVESKLGVKTIIANPFANMAVASRVSTRHLTNDAPAMMIACGLALRGDS
ncbi:MAG TPA: pilus assembly protein PilM [Thiotrichaceae bacterium]|nr:pilus assembly protein PilM [Thiotrichaceae bacterium]HIM08947.1 pilus assembly protein PilM [Gammaproteobacteria bacterium]